MPQRQLRHVLRDFEKTVSDSIRLASDANKWATPGSSPHITRKRCESMVELAFLHAYLAWEVFLEETFVLYLMGMTAPRGSTPRRYTFPPSRRHAMDWIAEGRDYAKWDAGNVKSRAQRYFEHGKPFTPVLQSHQNALDEAKTIRNAVAHESDSAQEKFKTLARQKLGGVLPPGITPAKFLNLSVPGSNPPLLFLQFYTQKFEYVAGEIVPT